MSIQTKAWCWNENVERYKARLVAQGYNQKYGIYYDETFCPVVRFESVRTLIALAAKHKFQLNQLDVATAFLNSELKEEIYIHETTRAVWSERKRTFGLWEKHLWFEAVIKMLEWSFRQRPEQNGWSLHYILNSGEEIFIIAVYVDNIILAGKTSERIQKFINAIAEKFDITDMGKLDHFVGIKIN